MTKKQIIKENIVDQFNNLNDLTKFNVENLNKLRFTNIIPIPYIHQQKRKDKHVQRTNQQKQKQ